jgi:glycerol kinase
VQRAARGEATALGAAMMAGLAAGFWADARELPEMTVDRVSEPSRSASERATLREQWGAALAVAGRWRAAGGPR